MNEIHPLLDGEQQLKAVNYERERRVMSLTGSLVSALVILAFHRWLASPLLRSLFPDRPVLQILLYFWAFLLFQFPVSLLFSWLGEYRREHRYNFSNQSFAAWLWDEIKGLSVAMVLFPFTGGVILALLTLYPESWFILAAISTALFSILLITVFPVVIMPLFNKYTPVDDEELISRLREILVDYGIKIKGFFVQDMSRQTRKENAFLAGLGRTRRVILSDNIMNNMSPDELETVLAHEVGHYLHRHMPKNILIISVMQIAVFFLIHLVMPHLSPAFLSNRVQNLIDLPLFLVVYSVISGILLGPLTAWISRRHEREADRTALEATDAPDAFISAMAGLANRNLSNAYPPAWIKLLFYSHPPVGERLEFAEKWKAASEKVSA